jgi:hypothetical protein
VIQQVVPDGANYIARPYDVPPEVVFGTVFLENILLGIIKVVFQRDSGVCFERWAGCRADVESRR